MGRTKHKKLAEVRTFPNVFDGKQFEVEKEILRYFKNSNPISLEIGCGHGDYTINLAKEFPKKNFIGIDIKGARIWAGAKASLDLKLSNAVFLISRAEWLPELFKNIKFSEIFIPFPDPHLRRKSAPRRLVSLDFLEVYKLLLEKGGRVYFKTDNEELYQFALKNIQSKNLNIIAKSENLYSETQHDFFALIKTKYEKHYLKEGRIIKYICFSFD
ncbi:tRNA (guanosine(46)-N7)-methyltransferase TrmB [Melioribacteraceae bacterium 4301-Me]|uniref:tRNA (guanosine(46)-N7)-methyltransferase TrmB n=1 Tax=Pyranulibacter aquaticus TaxID=3163344 RepID=UPI00359BD9E8